MVFGMGTSELIVILLVALVIFGPKNLPKLGSTIGKTVKNVREGMAEEDPDTKESKQKAVEVEHVEAKVVDSKDADDDSDSDVAA